ncbi:MAG: cobalamin biosynthesis protein CbiA [bacterium]
MSARHTKYPSFQQKIIIIVGGYGSGKSEIAVNLSCYLAESETEPVTIADLDIVNPYFRSREAFEMLARLGIRSIIPPGEQRYSELPIILPEIRGSIEHCQGWLVLDVGGDDVGARVLSSLSDAFEAGAYEMLLVLNANRPFTSDAAGSRRMITDIEASSRLRFTGLISNTHLMDQTTVAEIERGLVLAESVGELTGLPICFCSATEDLVAKFDPKNFHVPVLPLRRQLVKPWEHRTG